MSPKKTNLLVDFAGIGERAYMIRLALGDGFRTPMSQQEFSDYLRARGVALDKGDVSRMERGQRKDLSLALLEGIARCDPLQRGVLWLGWGWSPEHHDAKLTQHLLGKQRK